MRRRDFIKTAGVAAIATVGVTEVAGAYCKTMNGYISWREINRVTKDYGFGVRELLFPLGDPADESVHYRKTMEDGSVYSLGFNRIKDFKGHKYTYAWMEKNTPIGLNEPKFGGGFTCVPLSRGLLDPVEWESELRNMIYSSFVQGADAE